MASLIYSVRSHRSLTGTVSVPGDKSISHRAVMLSAIAEGESHIAGLLEGEDVIATIEAFKAMGVQFEKLADGRLKVHGVGLHGLRQPQKPLNLGNSGTAMRLLCGLLAGQSFSTELVGDDSLMQRPMARVVEPLRMMGAEIEMTPENTAPLIIKGGHQLQGIRYQMKIASAQVKSALLLAGLYAGNDTHILESGISRDHTERMLHAFDVDLQTKGSSIKLHPPTRLKATDFMIPGDISSAAFFIVGATVKPDSEVIINRVGINPTRIGIINILRRMGADIRLLKQENLRGELVADIKVRSAPLLGIEIPLEQVPLAIDEFPVLFIAAACAHGTTVLRGAKELRVKETDRIAAMAEGLERLGVNVEVLPDGIIIQGGEIKGGRVNSYGDHRVAMAFAIAGIVAQSEITIDNCANVATSFPNFTALATKLGLSINVNKVMPVLTVDGVGGTGKGTLCCLLSKALGWHFLDSGLLYRALAFCAMQNNIPLDDEMVLANFLEKLTIKYDEQSRLTIDNQVVDKAHLQRQEYGTGASKIGVFPSVRALLINLQRQYLRFPGLIADGRDMGTVIFPDAPLKIFLTAAPQERAKRRSYQLRKQGIHVSLQAILTELRERDQRDASRQIAPLKPATDAVQIDTTNLSINQVLEKVISFVRRIFGVV